MPTASTINCGGLVKVFWDTVTALPPSKGVDQLRTVGHGGLGCGSGMQQALQPVHRSLPRILQALEALLDLSVGLADALQVVRVGGLGNEAGGRRLLEGWERCKKVGQQ